MQERSVQVAAPDGSGSFAAHVTVPDAGRGPGIVVIHEIFGVNEYITATCRRLAELGYVALAPDLFWRIAPGLDLAHDEEGLARAVENVTRFDAEAAVGDVAAALDHLRALPEVQGGAGVFGFCLGGTLAYLFAATARVDERGPDAVVSYYGSAVNRMLDLAPRVECPVLFHYGAEDPYIPTEQIDEVEQAFAGRRDVVLHRYAAGHAFSNWDAPSMYDEAASRVAWERTLRFLDEILRPGR